MEPVVHEKPVIDGEWLNAEFDSQLKVAQVTKENALALAKDLAYDGALTVESLEEEIKFYQRRSVEAVLETGKRLLLLKEIAGHGNFFQRIEHIGFSDRMARKFMAATLKFSKRNSSSVLALPGMTQTKLLELLVLDDGEIEALNSGETVRGIQIEELECISVSELKTRIRKAERELKEQAAITSEAKRSRDERINKLEDELAVLKAQPKPERTPELIEAERIRFINDAALKIVSDVEAGLRSHFTQLEKLFPEGVVPNHARLAQQQALSQIIQAARALAGDFGVSLKAEDLERPELLWLRQSEALFGSGELAGTADSAPDASLLDDSEN